MFVSFSELTLVCRVCSWFLIATAVPIFGRGVEDFSKDSKMLFLLAFFLGRFEGLSFRRETGRLLKCSSTSQS
tara:strand:+ start:1082 stop:1300 length:219 start_codon:yes stop_codon:yes gene_type:complete